MTIERPASSGWQGHGRSEVMPVGSDRFISILPIFQACPTDPFRSCRPSRRCRTVPFDPIDVSGDFDRIILITRTFLEMPTGSFRSDRRFWKFRQDRFDPVGVSGDSDGTMSIRPDVPAPIRQRRFRDVRCPPQWEMPRAGMERHVSRWLAGCDTNPRFGGRTRGPRSNRIGNPQRRRDRPSSEKIPDAH